MKKKWTDMGIYWANNHQLRLANRALLARQAYTKGPMYEICKEWAAFLETQARECDEIIKRFQNMTGE